MVKQLLKEVLVNCSSVVVVIVNVFLYRYRGLQSFHSSPWDPKENLPPNYARVFQFDNFRRTQKRVLSNSENEDGIMVSMRLLM